MMVKRKPTEFSKPLAVKTDLAIGRVTRPKRLRQHEGFCDLPVGIASVDRPVRALQLPIQGKRWPGVMGTPPNFIIQRFNS